MQSAKRRIAESAPAAAGITRLLSYRISALSRALAREGAAIYSSKLGLTLPEWRVISALGHAGELSVTGISNQVFMDRGQTSRTVDALLEAGLVRMRPDVKNLRRTLFSLSPDGEALHAAGLPVAHERQRRLLQGFSAEEIAVFESVLDRLLGLYADNGKGDEP
jgi:DNA-binding MarR family transcriptional regulator